MNDVEIVDTWPMPDYGPDKPLHVHALGVIALNFVSFERCMEYLLLEKAREANVWGELAKQYFLKLSEEQRMQTISGLFLEHEKDNREVDLVKNIIEYFNWCRHCRNTLMHSELYPG
jgi:hypothetical protein